MEVFNGVSNNHSLILNATTSWIASVFNRYWYIGVIILLIFMIGFILNLIILFMMVKIDKIKFSSDIFFLHLTVCDLFICLVFSAYCIIVFKTYSLGWPEQIMTPVCRVSIFLLHVCSSLHVLTLVLIAKDRYRLILYPTRPALKSRTAYIQLASILVLSVCFPAVTLTDVIADSRFKFICIHSWEVNGRHQIQLLGTCYFFLIIFLLPGTVIAYCHFRVIKKLRQVSAITKERFGHTNSRHKDKAIRMLICVSVLFFIMGVPVSITLVNTIYLNANGANITNYDHEQMMIQGTLPNLLIFLAPLHNPVIYLTKKNMIYKYLCVRNRHTNQSD
ncbi:Neuropeptide FF receptor 2 [Trichoplax sp. H2]|nr:Neuropeptide FF receptor 2 [Trichoplax sp. H2]|eukprot:RDD40938.1 Neuropeptide FF receptor 2 [Trichoplax sp. H2]